jgi:putative transposase
MSTMHRLLRRAGQAGERRHQATHPARVKPELLATAPQQVWSWDITKLRGPTRGIYYDLYVILDIFSRYVVGWTVAATESAEIAEQLIADAITLHGRPHSLHADRGTSMTSKPVAQLLVDLGVARSHSRPHVSNDNPYSEAAFKTLKYAPVFPDRFGTLATPPACSARRSSATTTTNTATPASGCTLRPRCITALPAEFVRTGRSPWRPPATQTHAVPTPPTPAAQAARSRVDQRTQPGGAQTDELNRTCLIRLDIFRTRQQ